MLIKLAILTAAAVMATTAVAATKTAVNTSAKDKKNKAEVLPGEEVCEPKIYADEPSAKQYGMDYMYI